MDLEHDSLDVLGAQSMRVSQLHAAVDARMDHHAAGKRLVGVGRDLESSPELIPDLAPVAFRRKSLHEAALRLERLLGSSESMPREKCRGKPGTGGGTWMERFGH